MSFRDRFDGCNCRFRLPNTKPFYFENTNQKVMLITSSPSFQAVYRQLASIRFFRAIFLALFGPNPRIPEDLGLISFFEGKIYWTHYHKCYLMDETKEYDYKNPPEVCRVRHLENEIEEFNPQLIVLLGDPVVKRLTGLSVVSGDFLESSVTSKTGKKVPCICTMFPKTGAEVEMEKVRERIKPLIPETDPRRVPSYMVSDLTYEKDTFIIHVKYEFKALEMYWDRIVSSTKPPYKQDNIDNLWIKHEVVPKWIKYSFIVTCCSFIEDQIGALLTENNDLENRYLKEKRFPPILRVLLPRYDREYPSQKTSKLFREIECMRRIRHKIVHSGGRLNHLSPSDVDVGSDILGFTPKGCLDIEPSGMIVVSEKYCEYALGLVERFVDYITTFKTKN